MKQETKILLVLLLLPLALGELLSGYNSPLALLNPVSFFLSVGLYGCGALLIREAKVRWKLQWSIVFLAVAYGIVEEGLMTKSLFNPNWVHGTITGFGSFFGVNWPLAIQVIFFHATVSTLIPIAMVGLLWPKYKDVPLLGKKGLGLAFAGITLATLVGLLIFGTRGVDMATPYYPSAVILAGAIASVLLLCLLAYKFRGSRIYATKARLFSPLALGVFGVLATFISLMLADLFSAAGMGAATAILAQLIFTAVVAVFVASQVFNRRVEKRHLVSLIFGMVLYYILVTPILELAGVTGVVLVGIAALVLLIKWRRAVLRG